MNSLISCAKFVVDSWLSFVLISYVSKCEKVIKFDG